jgi:DNA-binding CsgD family transcriptional regulator
MGMAGFTEAELRVLAMRVNGLRPPEIVRNLGWKLKSAHKYMARVHIKTGIHDLSELRQWAIEMGLDEMPDLQAIRQFREPASGIRMDRVRPPRKRVRWPLQRSGDRRS